MAGSKAYPPALGLNRHWPQDFFKQPETYFDNFFSYPNFWTKIALFFGKYCKNQYKYLPTNFNVICSYFEFDCFFCQGSGINPRLLVRSMIFFFFFLFLIKKIQKTDFADKLYLLSEWGGSSVYIFRYTYYFLCTSPLILLFSFQIFFL